MSRPTRQRVRWSPRRRRPWCPGAHLAEAADDVAPRLRWTQLRRLQDLVGPMLERRRARGQVLRDAVPAEPHAALPTRPSRSPTHEDA